MTARFDGVKETIDPQISCSSCSGVCCLATPKDVRDGAWVTLIPSEAHVFLQRWPNAVQLEEPETKLRLLMRARVPVMGYPKNRWVRHYRLKIKTTDLGMACIFLEDGKCSIYKQRPWVCRVFPTGGGTCQLDRRRAGLDPNSLITKVSV
jgi:hypothetical protein